MAEWKYWTREESIVACALYAVTPYSKIASTNPKIIEVAEKLGRTPASLAMRMTQFASLDPVGQANGRKGFDSAPKQDREVWAAFQENWRAVMEQAEKIVGPLRQQ